MSEKPPARVPWKHSPDEPAPARCFPACTLLFFLFIAPEREAEKGARDLQLAGGVLSSKLSETCRVVSPWNGTACLNSDTDNQGGRLVAKLMGGGS